MSQKKRCVATIEVCLYVENDKQAQHEAEKLASALRRQLDNDAKVMLLVQPPVRGIGEARIIFSKY